MDKIIETILKSPNKVVAFISGDLAVTIWVFLGGLGNFWHTLGDFGLKIAATVILGIAGGVAGLVGKEFLYPKLIMFLIRKK